MDSESCWLSVGSMKGRMALIKRGKHLLKCCNSLSGRERGIGIQYDEVWNEVAFVWLFVSVMYQL